MALHFTDYWGTKIFLYFKSRFFKKHFFVTITFSNQISPSEISTISPSESPSDSQLSAEGNFSLILMLSKFEINFVMVSWVDSSFLNKINRKI